VADPQRSEAWFRGIQRLHGEETARGLTARREGRVRDSRQLASAGKSLPEGALLVLSALAVTLLFGVSSLDIAAARWFYRPTGTDQWPLAAQATIEIACGLRSS